MEPEIQEPKEGVSHKKWIFGGIIGGVAFVSVVTVEVLFVMGILGGKEEIVQTSAGVMQTDTEISMLRYRRQNSQRKYRRLLQLLLKTMSQTVRMRCQKLKRQ